MDWLMHRRVERQAIRMHEMLDRLDVDPVALVRLRNGDAYAGARSLCLSCGTSDCSVYRVLADTSRLKKAA